MKQQIKDNYAKSVGYDDFKCLLTDGSMSKSDLSIHYDRLMKEYAMECLKKASHNVTLTFREYSNIHGDTTYDLLVDTKQSIHNENNLV